MIKELKYMIIEYTDSDYEYIEEVIDFLRIESEKIVSFFKINDFGEKVRIKLFNNLDAFRNNCLKYKIYKVVPNWLCGLSYQNDNINYIDTLSLEEYKKTETHEKETLKDLKYLILHEFTHSCHYKLMERNNNYHSYKYKWLLEGLATTITGQYDSRKELFDATLDEMINGCSRYINYYTMFKYVLDNYGNNYILKLINDYELLKSETPRLYNEVIEYIDSNRKI